MTNQLTSIDFHGQTILTAQQDGIIYAAIKPICENIGLAWNAQLERINRDEVLNSTVRMIRMVANDGKNREMLCLPIQYLNGWLFGVDTNRVKTEIKDKLITYKKECYQVLFNYWNNGVAINPRLTSEQTLPLRNAVNMATGVLKLDYATIYKMIHQRFGIDEIKELSKDEVGQAVEYVHSLMIKANTQSTPLIKNCLHHLQDYAKLLKSLRHFPLLDEHIARYRHDSVVITYNQMVMLI